MTNKNKSFDFFPKEKNFRLQDAFIYWFLLGTFGVHQFYLRNKRRGCYLLITCGMSHLLILLIPKIYPALKMKLGFKLALIVILGGYILGAPVLLWDLLTLSSQVRDKKGQADLL